MAIRQGSRYQNGVQVAVPDPSLGGQPRVGVMRASRPGFTRFLHYETALFDRLDTLAYRFYGDSTLWWMIADANPEILFPEPLVPGSVIRIPQT